MSNTYDAFAKFKQHLHMMFNWLKFLKMKLSLCAKEQGTAQGACLSEDQTSIINIHLTNNSKLAPIHYKTIIEVWY